jgi:hypothetical protein
MSTTAETIIKVNPRYTEILGPLGDVQQAVDEAIRRYAVERASEQIAQLRRQIRHYEELFDATYEVFYAQITTDQTFVTGLRGKHPTWERDFHQWEFYVEEMREWLSRLEEISTP